MGLTEKVQKPKISNEAKNKKKLICDVYLNLINHQIFVEFTHCYYSKSQSKILKKKCEFDLNFF